MNQLSERYLEDFAVGQTFGSGRPGIDEDRALAFSASSILTPCTSRGRRRTARFSVDRPPAAGVGQCTRFRAMMFLLSHLSIT